MSVLLSPSVELALVSRLRRAGCVFAEEESHVLAGTARTVRQLAVMVARRSSGVPLEHVVGWASFCDRRVEVDDMVFVPRRRTELLVHQAARLARRGAVVLDLCCGSGAVGASVARLVEDVHLVAVDIDPAAVRCARRNVAPVGGTVHEGDLYGPLPPALLGRVDVIVANAPYVPSAAIATMPPEARLHEPRVALDGGPDGLDIQRRVAAEAPRWLAPGGHLLVETSRQQAPATVAVLAGRGLSAHPVSCEELDATVVIGAVPTPAMSPVPPCGLHEHRPTG